MDKDQKPVKHYAESKFASTYQSPPCILNIMTGVKVAHLSSLIQMLCKPQIAGQLVGSVVIKTHGEHRQKLNPQISK